MIRLLIILLTLSFHFSSLAEEPNPNIYSKLSIKSLSPTSSDMRNILGYYSPFMQFTVNYSLYGKDYSETKTFNIFGECEFLPYPVRFCSRVVMNRIDGLNRRQACLFIDNIDSRDFNLYMQPFQPGENLVNLMLKYNDHFSYIFDNRSAIISMNNVASYANYSVNATFNNESINSNYCFDLPTTMDEFVLKNYEDNITANVSIPKVILSKVCEKGFSDNVYESCDLIDNAKSTYDNLYFSVALITPSNLIPNSTYLKGGSNLLKGYSTFKDDEGNIRDGNMYYASSILNECSAQSSEGYCFKVNDDFFSNSNISDSEKSKYKSTFYKVINSPYFSGSIFEFNKLENREIGAVRFVQNGLNYGLYSFPFGDNFNNTQTYSIQYEDFGKTHSMDIVANYIESDNYICFTLNSAQLGNNPIGCLKRPRNMLIDKRQVPASSIDSAITGSVEIDNAKQEIVNRCRVNDLDRTSKNGITDKGTISRCISQANLPLPTFEKCSSDNCTTEYSEDNPYFIVKIGNYKYEMGVNRKVSIMGYPFIVYPVDTDKKVASVDDYGNYIKDSTKKFCLLGYKSYNLNHMVKRYDDQIDFIGQSLIVKAPSFWDSNEGEVVMDQDAPITESIAYQNGYNPTSMIVVAPSPIQDSSLKLCVDK